MNWYMEFCRKYLGVEFSGTFIDFLKFGWPVWLITIALCLIIL